MSDITRIVLKDVAKMKVCQFPKPTLICYLAVEQAMLNKKAARYKMATSDNPLMLHVDGTSKKEKGIYNIPGLGRFWNCWYVSP